MPNGKTVTILSFNVKIPTPEHKIMLHAVSLKGGSRKSGSGACLFVRVTKQKADTLNSN